MSLFDHPCTENVLLALPRPIAIVGNGHPGRELGGVIDRYPTIIRLNNYRVEGFESLVGTRTSLRATSGWTDIEPRETVMDISPFRADARESSNWAHHIAQRAVPCVASQTDIHPLLPDLAQPSTGLALVLLCAALEIDVDLFGFDGFRSGHYWSAGAELHTTHDRRELDVLLQLPNVTLYGQSYDYESLYNFCHSAHTDYNTNEGLALYRKLGISIHGERLIEFGAGNGGLSAQLQKQGNEVTAIEVSQVAFERIPVARKINGDCLTLAQLDGEYDRVVSMDVLEHLTENDIRIVVAQAARLAKSILFSISTRPSGLLGPQGENLHLTVRSPQWWREALERHFQVTMMKGVDLGQVLIEGMRHDVAGARTPTVARPDDHFELPATYRARAKAEYYVDSPLQDGGVTWQPDVYPAAADLARALGCDTLIDVGCGHARKLMTYTPEFQVVGFDFGANLAHCRATHAKGVWLEADLECETLFPVPDAVLARSVLICSDVIEHLSDPRALLTALAGLLQRAPVLVLSTPDRIRTRGAQDDGPPANPAHTREWSLDELVRLLRRSGLTIASATHTRSNDAENNLATSLIIAINPTHPAIAAQWRGAANLAQGVVA